MEKLKQNLAESNGERVQCSICTKPFIRPSEKKSVTGLSSPSVLKKGMKKSGSEAFVLIDTSTDQQKIDIKQCYKTGEWQGHTNAKIEFIDRLDHLVAAKQTECLCHDCLHLLVHALDAESDYLENQISSYSKSNQILQGEEIIDTDFSTTDTSSELVDVLSEELRELMLEHETVQNQLSEADDESHHLQQQLDTYWNDYNEMMREVEDYQQEMDGHSVKIEDMQQEIALLKTKHVYQEVFNINLEGPIASINGFRMGSLAKEKVEWREMNASFGRAALLLWQMIEFTKKTDDPIVSQYRIVPKESLSYIWDKTNNKEYPLCNEGEFSAWYLLSDSNFDVALSLLLQCLKNVSDWASRNDQVNVPHRVEKDKIYAVIDSKEEGLSIKFRSNSYEKWSAALKCMLANLKHLLLWFEKKNKISTS
eukprot:TRINITY_DN13274_c0_g1_i1.p1 TRINITY_DN13274_c0_g1~~TRINITY_DN13274_c0_g1_i1.p1  ORF type:complete len:423 (+),score=91.30 TRINITY_DN13274_c0_g1_i1:91-1359(+)